MRRRGPPARGFIVALAVSVVACAAPAAEPLHHGISTGVDVSRGDYGLEGDTTLRYLPVTLRLDRGPWTGRVTLAHLQVTGPAGATTFGGGRRERESGFGDVVLSVTHASEMSLAGPTWLDVTAKVKVPTADEERGLGTGAWDATVQVEVLRSLGAWTPFASLGYRVLGDAPDTPLDNGFIASVGIDRRVTSRLSAGALLDYREPGSRGSDDALEFVPYVAVRVGRGVSFTAYATLGLADGSPAHGLGMQLGFRSDH